MPAIGSSSPAMDPTAGSAERSYDSVDPAQVLGSLKGVSRVLSRLPCALVPAGGSSGTAGSSRRGASCNPEGLAEIGVGGSAGLGLACHALDSSGRFLIRVGDGRPVSIGRGNNLTCRSMGPTHCSEKSIYKMQRSNIELGDLPEDVLHRVFSKLQLNEVVRTSVLSKKWRHLWTISSKLNLHCVVICGSRRYFCGKRNYAQRYIDRVNTVVKQLRDKVIEELEVKVEFDSILVDPLNKWIDFAVSSHTKNLALDLAPYEFMGVKDKYMFPIELFDSSSFVGRLAFLIFFFYLNTVQFDASCFEGIGWGTLRSLPRYSYNYLKKVHITGFSGMKGQLEFLVHIVENAPVLKVLIIDPRKKLGLCRCNASHFLASRDCVRRKLAGKILPSTEVDIL